MQPLYEQVKKKITESLVQGEWNPGEVIPSEIELANVYDVSQGTVRKAIDELMIGRTTIVVGHSIDAIKGSTNVCVLENGQISEQGEMSLLLEQNQESKLKKYMGEFGNKNRDKKYIEILLL